jgi:Cu(I)/Ag(I) efflux system membrane fusion protein
MAFNNKGAYWLSETEEITNPYFGASMLASGEEEKTYSKK